MALDVGDRRIGVALSDPTHLIASPLTIITRTSERRDHQIVKELVAENDAGIVVVGLPATLRGEIGYQAERVIRFAHRLGLVLDVPIELWDERHSTADAKEIVADRRGRKGRQRGGPVDDVAAAVVLQTYLNRLARNREQPSN